MRNPAFGGPDSDDPAMHWVAHLQNGPRRVNHAAAAVGDMIFTFGGYSTGDNAMYSVKGPIDVHVLHTQYLEWREIPRPLKGTEQYDLAPYQRYGHTAVAYEKYIYVWGGRNDELACNRLFCFDTETFKWSCPPTTGVIPCSRDGHSACIIGRSMYIFGGYEEEFERYSQDIYALDLDRMYWTYVVTQGTPPEFRDFHTGTAIEDRMYIFGGRSDMDGPNSSNEDFYPNSIMYLDTVNKVWHRPTTYGETPIGRRSHSAFLYDGQLYIFGGYNGLCKEHYNDLHCFCPLTNTWSQVTTYGQPPNERRRQVCIVINNKMYLFGGTSPTEFPHFDAMVELLDHNDLHVLDLKPTLRTLCMLKILAIDVDLACGLPADIMVDLKQLKERNASVDDSKAFTVCFLQV